MRWGEDGLPHVALWAALTDHRDSSYITDLRGCLVYHYSSGKGTYTGPDTMNADQLRRKCDALDAYKVWDPGKGRYAIGRHSVGSLPDGLFALVALGLLATFCGRAATRRRTSWACARRARAPVVQRW